MKFQFDSGYRQSKKQTESSDAPIQTQSVRASLPQTEALQNLVSEGNDSLEQVAMVALQILLQQISGKADWGDESFQMLLQKDAESIEALSESEGLSLSIQTQAEHVDFILEFDPLEYDPWTLQNWMESYQTILQGAVEHPSIAVKQLPWLSESQQTLQLKTWNGQTDFHPGEAVHQLIAGQALAHPERCAIRYAGKSYSYRQLMHDAKKVAGNLQRFRAEGNEQPRIAIFLERSYATIASMLGVWVAGYTLVPIDTDLPHERIRHILDDTNPLTIVTDRVGQKVMRSDLGFLRSVLLWEFLMPGLPVEKPSKDSSLAYILYTSGSSGKPKGAMVSHDNFLHYSHWFNQAFPLDPEDRLLHKCPYAFDSAFMEIFPPLAAGSQLVVAEPGLHRDAPAIYDLIEEESITVIYFVVTMLKVWLPLAEDEALRKKAKNLKFIITGGEALSGSTTAQCSEYFDARLSNLYGPTETTINNTYFEDVREHTGGTHSNVPIGRPQLFNQCLILNEQHQLVMPGGVGELYIAGPMVGQGYLNRPDLTEKQFLTNPHWDENTDALAYRQMYKTGDRVRWQSPGIIEFLGRGDGQLKINGQRIELGEIQSLIEQHESILQAVVIAKEEAPGQITLAAFVRAKVTLGGEVFQAIKKHLAQHLSQQLCPSSITQLDEFPTLPSGKLDHKALEEEIPSQAQDDKVNMVNPRDHIEMQLYRIWREVLKHGAIGITDNFFEVGGASMSAIFIMRAVNKYFGTRVAVSEMIKNPTIEEMGAIIRNNQEAQVTRSNVIPLQKGHGQKNLFCVHPAGGTAFCYLALANRLDEEIGVYGIQSLGVNPGEPYLPTIREMADFYLDSIQNQIDVPHVIAGWSLGGIVAYEVARQLWERGNPHTTLVIFDTQASNDQRVVDSIQPISRDEFVAKLVRFNGMFPGIDEEQIDQYFGLYNNNVLSLKTYDRKPHGGRTVLIKATQGKTEDEIKEEIGIWRSMVTSDMEVAYTSGSHWTLMDPPDVDEVADIITQVLDRPTCKTEKQEHYVAEVA